MTFFQALVYFSREAALNLVRSWKVSLLAVLTITLSLFLTGSFLLVSGNLARLTEEWRAESKVVVYLETGAEPAAVERLRASLEDEPWSLGVDRVTPEEASERFRNAFPSLGDLLEGWGEEPLPASLEITVDWDSVEAEALGRRLDEVRREPAVDMVDDDRDWLDQLDTAVLLLRALALALGGVLLLTAVFTIASIIRLTAYLYRDEIAVQRMVGATEFFIRGPFYVEGLFQGLLGGIFSSLLLAVVHWSLRGEGEGLLVSLLLERFLTPSQVLLLVVLGGGAGLIGAVASLRREDLDGSEETVD